MVSLMITSRCSARTRKAPVQTAWAKIVLVGLQVWCWYFRDYEHIYVYEVENGQPVGKPESYDANEVLLEGNGMLECRWHQVPVARYLFQYHHHHFPCQEQ